MRNVADIKREKNLNFILPRNYCLAENAYKEYGAVLVVVHLHYLDTIDYYLDYVKNIPIDIKVIFTVSDLSIAGKIEEKIKSHRGNYEIFIKENRGRDISAFLVACHKEILEYEYFCFIHDKKERVAVFKKDTQEWIRCLWENTIGSANYIRNILHSFIANPQLGIMAPPLPIAFYLPYGYENTWHKNFTNVKELSNKWQLNCNLDDKKSHITYGTVFWARTSALRKLLLLDWKYEDFDPEPLAADGTISHAIERILPYVAQDAGYDTGWVMTDQYAGERLEYAQEVLHKAFFRLRTSLGITNVSGLDRFEYVNNQLKKFCNDHEKIYIYGKGDYGKACLARLRFLGKTVDGFLVTKLSDITVVEGIPVYRFSKDHLGKGTGIIVAIRYEKQDEILKIIWAEDQEFSNLYHYDGVWSGN